MAIAIRGAVLGFSLLLALAMAVHPVDVGVKPCSLDFRVPDGHFYSQTGEETGRGFVVYDDIEANFWTAFQSEGGVFTLGFPVSNRYRFKGLPTQAFQKAILQWDSVRGRANFLNTLDELGLAGRDPELLVYRQTPPHVALIEDSNLNPAVPTDFARVVENHLKVLTQNAVIHERFLAESRWLDLYGLPVSYADFGPVQVLRAQRQVFQVWTVDDGGGPKNVPVLANAGDLAKEFGLIPSAAIEPVEPAQIIPAEPALELAQSDVRQGDVLVVKILGTSQAATVTLGTIVAPAVCDSGSLAALVPISSTTEPGDYVLRAVVTGDPTQVELERTFSIGAGVYPSVQIELSADVQALLAPEIVEEERILLASIFGVFGSQRRWDGAFEVPAAGPPTSPFGERRSFGPAGPYDYHRGHDIAASSGTPVLVAQRGVVAWAAPLRVRGNTVIVDHGRGVFSAYLHLSAIDVNVGDELKTGDRLGAVGSTGVSTGAHLHWEIRVLNVPVDPLQWTRPGALTG